MPKKISRASRLGTASPEDIRQQWVGLRGKAVKGTAFFLCAAIILFCGNHFSTLSQTMVNIVNVAFQVACVFSVCGTFMVIMSLAFGRRPRKSQPA